jgi:hypothetical protein
MRVLFAVIALSLLPVTGCASHHGSPESFEIWQLEGAVTAVDASSIQVRHKSGRIVVVEVDDQTTYLHHKQPASKDMLIKGTRVIVEVERHANVDHALRVEIFEGARRSS